MNGKNAFVRSDAETPLQFLYQPANCRFFYTPEMVHGPELVWKRTVDATWTDPVMFCVEGSRVVTNESALPDDPVFRQIGETEKNGAGGLVAMNRVVFSVFVAVLVVLAGLL